MTSEPRPDDGAVLNVHVELLDVPTRPWRRLALAADLPLDAAHAVLQAAFGWTDSHLHRFYTGGEPFSAGARWYGSAVDVAEDDTGEGHDESGATLGDLLTAPGDQLHYLYDFGDHWDHLVTVESVTARPVGAPAAVLHVGEDSAPEEDSRGTLRWDDEDWADAGVPRPDPPAPFDVAATRVEVAQALLAADALPRLGEVPFPVTMFLTQLRGPGGQLVRWRLAQAGVVAPGPVAAGVEPTGGAAGDELDAVAVRDAVRPFATLLELVRREGPQGLALTAAGSLPPRAVVELVDVADPRRLWIGAGNREDLTPPVAMLRADAQAVKLLRVAKGRLLATPAGRRATDDPEVLLRHLLQRLPLSRSADEHDAGILALIAVATGRAPLSAASGGLELLSAGMESIGWRIGGRAVNASALSWAAHPTVVVLRHLGALLPDGPGLSTGDAVSPTGAHLARRALQEWPPR